MSLCNVNPLMIHAKCLQLPHHNRNAHIKNYQRCKEFHLIMHHSIEHFTNFISYFILDLDWFMKVKAVGAGISPTDYIKTIEWRLLKSTSHWYSVKYFRCTDCKGLNRYGIFSIFSLSFFQMLENFHLCGHFYPCQNFLLVQGPVIAAALCWYEDT